MGNHDQTSVQRSRCLLDRGQMAMKAAVEKVTEEHAREGLPLYVWRDGRVVAVSAEELRPGNGRRGA